MDWIRQVHSDQQGYARISGRKIYILPTRYGLLFGVLLLTLLISSINYANNPAFLLTFLLFGLLLQAILATWYNLNGLQLRYLGYRPLFAGETAYIQLQLQNDKPHYAIQLRFENQPAVVQDCIGTALLSVPYATDRRGIFQLPRLIVESRYPLGLFRAWSYVHLDIELIVWPRLIPSQLNPHHPDQQGSASGDRGEGTEDFIGYRHYRPGDPSHHIAWKMLAAEKGLLVKQFGGSQFSLLWLDFNEIQANHLETKLSLLADQIQQLAQQGRYYGLKLPHQTIEPSRGERHRQACLNALARL